MHSIEFRLMPQPYERSLQWNALPSYITSPFQYQPLSNLAQEEMEEFGGIIRNHVITGFGLCGIYLISYLYHLEAAESEDSDVYVPTEVCTKSSGRLPAQQVS